MPLTDKQKKTLAALKQYYGDKAGSSVFYAMENGKSKYFPRGK